MWWMYFCLHYTITASMIIAINEWRSINTCRMEWEDTFQPNIHSCKSEYPLRRTHQTKHFNSHYSVTAALPSHKLWSCLGCCCYYFIFMSTDHSDILRFCLSLFVLDFKWYVMSSSDLRKQGQDVHSEPPVYGEEVGSPVEILQTDFSWEVWHWTRGTPQEFVGRGKCDAFQLYCVLGYILCFKSKTPRGPRQ